MGSDHEHHHHTRSADKTLLIAIVVTGMTMLAEVVGGFLSNSLALMADAGHMFTDMTALILSFIGLKLSQKKASSAKSFGYSRYEIIIGLINGLFLWSIALFIGYEAVGRIFSPEPIDAWLMMIIAVIGLVMNLLIVYLLVQHSKDNLNIRAAFLHVVGDTLGSVGAIVSGILILITGWYLFDPLVSIFIAFLIIYNSRKLISDSIHILLEGTPKNVDPNEVIKSLSTINGVRNIHDLHIWSISSKQTNLSCHLVVEQITESSKILEAAHQIVSSIFGIYHASFQIEPIEFNNCHNCGEKTHE